MFSHDGSHVAIFKRDASSGGLVLHLLTLQRGALGDSVVATNLNFESRIWDWSADSRAFVYTLLANQSDHAYVAGPGVEAPHLFAEPLTALVDIQWADNNSVYILGSIGSDGWNLYRQTTGSEPGAAQTLATGLGLLASISVRP